MVSVEKISNPKYYIFAIIFRRSVEEKRRKMREETIKRRKQKQELLRNLKFKAAKDLYQLRRLRFTVESVDTLPLNYKWRELTYDEIYSAESFWIWSGCKCILRNCSFFALTKFTKVAKQFRRKYGVKKLHDHMDELAGEFMARYPEEKIYNGGISNENKDGNI